MEMRENFLHQVLYVSNFILDGFVRSIRSNKPASPLFLDDVEEFSAVCILANRKTRSYLPPELVSPARLERNAETSFSIDKS